MKNTYCENWGGVKERFTAWWARDKIGYPLMHITAATGGGRRAPQAGHKGDPRVSGEGRERERQFAPAPEFTSLEDMYTNADKIVARYRRYCETHWFLEDSYPSASLNLGPGSLALYVGSEPIFAEDTLWYKECIDDWDAFGGAAGIKYDPDNRWWRLHLDMIKKAKSLSGDDFLVTIPDIIENLDIVSALRGPQNLCYDLMDRPETIREAVKKVDELYFVYYDAMYDIVKEPDGSSAYTAFNIWGPGRTAKIQCDFCALMSPGQFRDLVQPSLRLQCQRLDNSIYHLDGPDAIKHVPALMEIDELGGLQWTCGAGQPDGGCERWYPIYDQVRAAGKSLWVAFGDGGPQDWVDSAVRLIKRYGPDCFYFIFPEFADRAGAEGAAQAIRAASGL